MAGNRRYDAAGDLPEIVPVFPLSGALLLPSGQMPLNIFEPRYLAMVDAALAGERLIGMIQPALDAREGGQHPRLCEIGCLGRITQFSETGDGRYLITLSGVSRFRSCEFQEGFTPYLRARVAWDSFERDLGRAEQDPAFDRAAFLTVLARFFETAQLSSDWDSLKEADVELLVNSLSILCPFDPEEKQALLEAPTLGNRRETLATLMEFALRSSGDDGAMQ